MAHAPCAPRADSPDVIRATNFQMPEYVATGSLMQLDELVARDKIDPNDWPRATVENDGARPYLRPQQDYPHPDSHLPQASAQRGEVEPPRSWADVCVTGAKLSEGQRLGFANPGSESTGGIGGAQAFGEIPPEHDAVRPRRESTFADDNRAIAFSKDAFIPRRAGHQGPVREVQVDPMTSLQYGYNEVHDGLRADTVAMATFGLYRYRTIQTQGGRAMI
jgi:hypothetical protein